MIRTLSHSAGATVERLYEGDSTSVALATFEYSYQADMFAKAISKESDGTIIVRTTGREYADCAFECGKKVRDVNHWINRAKWAD